MALSFVKQNVLQRRVGKLLHSTANKIKQTVNRRYSFIEKLVQSNHNIIFD